MARATDRFHSRAGATPIVALTHLLRRPGESLWQVYLLTMKES